MLFLPGSTADQRKCFKYEKKYLQKFKNMLASWNILTKKKDLLYCYSALAAVFAHIKTPVVISFASILFEVSIRPEKVRLKREKSESVRITIIDN
jgi:hypothetical protein